MWVLHTETGEITFAGMGKSDSSYSNWSPLRCAVHIHIALLADMSSTQRVPVLHIKGSMHQCSSVSSELQNLKGKDAKVEQMEGVRNVHVSNISPVKLMMMLEL
ncbi:hypothetical protein KIL84_011489 [Mauremys mutica]|uniref:Uncharacterized protein n=1 Tax=Mauremys mutica TaxID=74926 RepID=A0A9D3XD41_9SAUR|nr:hypothetical protein KIL84_011489 [Mauremys mutica]